MKKFIAIISAVLSVTTSFAQLFFQPESQVTASGNVKIVASQMNVVNNSGSVNLSNSTLVMKGAGSHSVGGSSGYNLKSLVIDKSGTVLLGSPITITDSISMKNGLLDLNGQFVQLLPAASVEGENENTRIIGPNGGELAIVLPLNAPNAIDAGKLGAIITSDQNLGNVIIKRGHVARIPAGEGNSIRRYYDIQPSVNQSLNATLRFKYLDAELNNLSENNLQIFRSSDNGAHWFMEAGGTRNTSENYVERSGLSSLQLYTLSPSAALPLLWGKIKGRCEKGRIIIEWETLQEKNTSKFTVQQNNNGNEWTNIATISAAGNSNTSRNYRVQDLAAPANSPGLYRIAAEDLDGSIKYSPVIHIQNCTEEMALKLWPVPVKNRATLSLNSSATMKATLHIIGADGRQWQNLPVQLVPGSNELRLELGMLPAGTYYIRLEMEDRSRKEVPFVKQ